MKSISLKENPNKARANEARSRRPDTTDMVLVHRIFRREFRLAPRLIRGVQPGDTVQANEIARHLSDLADGLHLHHSSEDDIVWPKILERSQPDTDLVVRMQNQHAVVVRLVAQFHERLLPWSDTANPEAGSTLAETCEELSKVLDEHLGEEEERILPLIEEHLTSAEWAQVGERGFAEVPKNRLLFFLGALCEDATSAERADFMRLVPLPGRLAFALFGQRQYRREMARLRSGLHDSSGVDTKLK